MPALLNSSIKAGPPVCTPVTGSTPQIVLTAPDVALTVRKSIAPSVNQTITSHDVADFFFSNCV